MASIETAIESRKGSWNDFESFKYILAVRLGDFHLQMNAVIKNLVALMPPKSSKNVGSLAYFANRIVVTHLVSNKPNLIKKVGNYETNKQFLLLIGSELLRDSLQAFFPSHIEDLEEELKIDLTSAKNLLARLIVDFLEKFNLKLWFKPEESPEYYDDLNKYSCDTASRSLLLMVFSHAVKYGDAVCIRACHKIFAIFFYGHDKTSSKYSPCIMNTLIDYDAASCKERMMIDLFSSINCYGSHGKGVPGDMVCEWGVKTVKGIESRSSNNTEATLSKRNVKTANITIGIKESYLQSILCENLILHGEHSTKTFKEDDIDEIRWNKS